MRPNHDRNIQRSGTLVGDDTRMSIDLNSIAHIMDVLTDLYSDPALAVIREYSTNALDSHIAAGNDDPIEVTLPSEFEPTFIVRDQGVGLSVDDLRDIYSKYGLSTKRDTDSEVGMLGLGCKSALTFTASFTINAVKNGVRATANVSRGEDGVGTISIVDTRSTDESDGVEVRVPVKWSDPFRRKAESFFSFWQPGTVLVNGSEPEFPKGVWVDDTTLITQHTKCCYIVMGNVPYEADRRSGTYGDPCAKLPYDYHVVKWAKMGEVNFPPNRESLQFTSKTEAVIRSLSENVTDKLEATAQRDVANAKTQAEAFDAAVKWTPLVNTKFTWKGLDLPTRFDCPGSFLWTPNSYGRRSTKAASNINRAEIGNIIQVVNFGLKNVVTSHRKKVERYCELNDIDISSRESTILFTSKQVGSPWTDNSTIIDYEKDIRPIRLSGGSTGSTSGPTTYRTWDGDEWFDATIEDIEGDDIILFSPAMLNAKRRGDPTLDLTYVKTVFPDSTLVEAGQNSWDKIDREVDNVRDIFRAVEDEAAKMKDGLNDEERLALGGITYTWDKVGGYDPDRVDDPELVEVVENARGIKNHANLRSRWQRLNVISRGLGRRGQAIDVSDLGEGLNKMKERYPLLGEASPKHRHEYVNALYAYREDE